MDVSKLVISFFVFFIKFGCYYCMNGHYHKCPNEQRDALLLFKQNISSVNINWETSLDCCDWVGITCDNLTGDVISVNLRDGNLQGVSELDTLLSHLPKLKTIDLSYSGLSVVIRNDARNITSDLYELRLASCNLTMFPYFIHDMKNLRIIDLSENYISGVSELDILLSHLPKLKAIDLSYSGLSVVTRNDAHNASSDLYVLRLASCNLTMFPYFLHAMKNLRIIDLSDNYISGVSELDTLLSHFPKLATFDLSYSGLSVVTRNDVRNVNSDLYELRLASCNITMFPYFLRGMKNLRTIDLSNNYISGHIPAWAGEIGGNNLIYLSLSENSITSLPQFTTNILQYLYLQTNLLQGSFPTWICKMKHLKYLDVSSNNISGVIPQCLGNMSSSLVYLNIKANMIQGPLPTISCNMSSLLYLDMSDNNFHGVIPQCFGNITSSIKLINLGRNNFYGTIPKVYGNCDLSAGLILNGNMLEGEVPRSLAKCQSMKILDLGNNRLNDTFPRWLGYLQKLQILNLRSNNLHGTIETPSAIEFLFPSLKVFDISSNGFVGRLPEKYFESFNAIKDVDKEPKTKIEDISSLPSYSITFQVKDRLSFFSLVLVTGIDLSSNKFGGEIPNVIGNLRSLWVLNLSNNNLNGQIPHVLGNLVSIEVLDLSRNQLQGEIPQSLVNLSYLSLFNVSQNHLVGHIPVGSQFNTFSEDSYLGNLGLCGLPLNTYCEDLKSTPKVEAKGGEWIYVESVMLGLGFGSLLGVGFGYGMLSTGRPKWLNALVDVKVHTRRKKKKQRHIKRRN